MSELPWFDAYSGQTTGELIALEGVYRIDSLVVAFEDAIQQKWARVEMSGLSEEECIVLAVEALERQVNNGGYQQFFINSSVLFAPVVVDALNRIGCPKTAEITQQAIKALGLSGPFSADEAERALDVDSEPQCAALEECDSRYFRRPENIEVLLFAFIKENKDKIILP